MGWVLSHELFFPCDERGTWPISETGSSSDFSTFFIGFVNFDIVVMCYASGSHGTMTCLLPSFDSGTAPL